MTFIKIGNIYSIHQKSSISVKISLTLEGSDNKYNEDRGNRMMTFLQNKLNSQIATR